MFWAAAIEAASTIVTGTTAATIERDQVRIRVILRGTMM
jgi:hypothetical protein